MLLIFLGPDDFSKKQEIKTLAGKNRSETQYYYPEDELPDVSDLISQDLFSKPKIFVLENLLGKLESKNTEALIKTQNQIILLEEKIDKRSSVARQFFSNKKIKAQEFNLPHGGQLNRWIEDRVKTLGGQIDKDAAEFLAVKLGRDEARETKIAGKVVETAEAYNLWQADNEIKKLLAFVGSEPISKKSVQDLVHYDTETDVFEITNALAEKDRPKTLSLIDSFLLNQNVSDQKTSVLQLAALLAEQFRNVAVVNDFIESRVSDMEILKKTLWKSGRLFVMKKISQKFSLKKVLDLLNKLENLDQELKTSSVPPRAILDLIVSQVF